MAKILGTPGWWWDWFVATTPRGRHTITGEHCLHQGAGELYGALLVESVDGEECSQLLPGMPEIPYEDQEPLSVPPGAVAGTFTRKMDGTAIIFSPLESPRGDVIEVFARTRGMPVLCDMEPRPWRRLVAEATSDGLRGRIEEAVRAQRATLVFELWGRRNGHAVSYDEPLALALHTAVRGRSIQPWRVVERVSEQFDIPRVPVLERITAPTVERLAQTAQALAEEMEAINAPALGRFGEEGVILNVETQNTARVWKVKPPSMAEYHRFSREKVVPLTVRHEAWKLVEGGQWPPELAALEAALVGTYGEEAVEENEGLIRREFALWFGEVYHAPDLAAEAAGREITG